MFTVQRSANGYGCIDDLHFRNGGASASCRIRCWVVNFGKGAFVVAGKALDKASDDISKAATTLIADEAGSPLIVSLTLIDATRP
jgi:hypothetical protein